MNYKAIIADIDGTIVPVKIDALPSPKVKEAIQKATEKGITFSLATGRPFGLVEYLVDYLQLKSPIIIDNGAAIYSAETKQSIYDALLDTEEANKIIKIVHKYTKKFHVSTVSENLFSIESIPSESKVRKFVIHGLIPQKAEKLIEEVEKKFKNLHVTKASANEGKEFLDVYISHASATKQVAILELAKILGIETEEIIAIGDHYNDFPLFMACGFKVAMGNAVDDLKAIADYVAPSVEEDGVAHVIEEFILSEK